MKKIITIAMMILVLAISVNSFAATKLTINITADKTSPKVGENVQVTVDWTEKMQAADYTLKYDATKLEFVSANISENFYNAETAGKIDVVWMSMDDKDLTKMTFTFKVKAEGKSEFSVIVNGKFSDGNMEMPSSYDTSKKLTITTPNSTSSNNDSNKNNNTNNVINNGNTNNTTNNVTNNNNKNNVITNNTTNNVSTKNETKVDSTVSQNKIPHAGKEGLAILSIVLITIGIFAANKNKEYKDIK